MIIERALGDTCGERNGIDADRADALVVEQRIGGSDEFSAGLQRISGHAVIIPTSVYTFESFVGD
jgi:hypothetical protein